MRKIISVAAVASLFVAGSAMASGYRIPEQSVDSTAKAGANIASADKADVTYYNPAGMSLLEDTWHFEGTATYLRLSEIEYDDTRPGFDATGEKEDFLLPTFFVVSPDYNNFRFGFSLTESYGLQKRWKEGYPKAFAEKFSLKVFEFNPTVSYKINDMFSIGGGVRFLYNEATVASDATGLAPVAPGRFIDGDTTEWGYNLAVDVKPNDNLNFAITYRSNIDLDFEGDVELNANGATIIDTTGTVSVPAPAVLAFSAAYTWEQWTFDLTIDRTFWSEYESLDFDYAVGDLTDPSNPYFAGGLFAAFDAPVAKDWDDTTCIRLGVEYRLNPTITLLGGIAYDENPVPDENLSFELPDSDAWLFSAGVRYKYSEQMEFGVAVLYDYKEERTVTNDVVSGEFSNASAFLISLGASYKF
ncbi:OmpP1/FadL family transporter [Desulfosediminicola flagellatus]|uniref:OmpP1/FadL family transporter n=1 Tax=Desulfosediminicola flagellatus TaxID=2569541 RepID=UPI0010AD593F|nr:OmpP1/FadL family transporter [Desulfosediminicola flagellatus]